jgi:Tol biopolymer transport system component
MPDGKHILCLVRAASESGDAEGDAVFVVSLDGSTRRMLVQSSFNPGYSNGHLLYARGTTLLAQPLDASSLAVSGEPVTVVDDMLSDPSYNMAVYTASATGLLVYQTGRIEGNARPILLDRNGKVVQILDDKGEQDHPRFSPDGRQLAMYLYDQRSRRTNIWIADLKTGGIRRLTTRQEGDFYPVWAPDGARIFFSSGTGRSNVYYQSVSHSGSGEAISSLPGVNIVRDCSPNGRWLTIESEGDIFLLAIDGKAEKPVPFQATRFYEEGGRISPDNTWVTYTSDESGQVEAYVKKLSAPVSDPWKLSSDGAFSPLWGPDGTEVFYINNMNQMVRARVRFTSEGPEAVTREVLFPVPPFTTEFDLSPDGRVFVFTRSLELKKFEPLSIIVAWEALLK